MDAHRLHLTYNKYLHICMHISYISTHHLPVNYFTGDKLFVRHLTFKKHSTVISPTFVSVLNVLLIFFPKTISKIFRLKEPSPPG